MKINVKHVAKLANLPLSEDEEKKFEKQISAILTYFEKLKEVNTDKVGLLGTIQSPKEIRKDETKPSISQEKALQNGKSTHNGLFKVKAVLGE